MFFSLLFVKEHSRLHGCSQSYKSEMVLEGKSHMTWGCQVTWCVKSPNTLCSLRYMTCILIKQINITLKSEIYNKYFNERIKWWINSIILRCHVGVQRIWSSMIIKIFNCELYRILYVVKKNCLSCIESRMVMWQTILNSNSQISITTFIILNLC